jgi:hypothetical protein
MATIDILINEISNDPLAKGYAGMTDEEITVSLNTIDRPDEDRDSLSSTEIFELINPTEYDNLTADQKDKLKVLLGLGTVKVNTGSQGRTLLSNLFGPGTNTRTALINAATQFQARWKEIGFPREVVIGDVTIARAG